MPSSPNELRIAVIGAGEVAARHARSLRGEPRARFVAVAEPDARRREEFAREWGMVKSAATHQEILADPEIDCVLVLTPHHLHLPVVRDALRARKHVICEKPMARTVAECDAMLAEVAPSGRELHVTHSLRADPFYLGAREALRGARGDGDGIGRVLLASFRWYTDELRRLDDPGHWKGTIDRSGGGVFIDGGCHVADLANALFGRARRVSASAGKLQALLPDRGEDNGAFLVEYHSGAVVTCSLSFTAGSAFRGERFGAGMDVDIFGSEAHLAGGYLLRDQRFTRYFREHRPGGRLVEHPEPPEADHLVTPAMVKSILDGSPPPLTAVDARNAVAVVEAAYRSIRTGRIEDVDWRG